MTIKRNRFYVLAVTPGISGFQRWGELEYRIVTGHKAANNRSSVAGELEPCAEDVYRLEDGHLPDHQPTARGAEALAWLEANRFSSVVVLNRKPSFRKIV